MRNKPFARATSTSSIRVVRECRRGVRTHLAAPLWPRAAVALTPLQQLGSPRSSLTALLFMRAPEPALVEEIQAIGPLPASRLHLRLHKQRPGPAAAILLPQMEFPSHGRKASTEATLSRSMTT